ncbi:hypothetical protein GCM10010214_31610 [Streptomyces abikoensis]|nr:hypothetical protein GCM10010214_31610 [Streptomyces abikoensis]
MAGLPRHPAAAVQAPRSLRRLPAALWAGAGGIRGLCELIRHHGRAVEADLRREYGVRLRDVFTGELTWRELSSLVHGLPPASATRTALNEGTPEPSGEEIVLADLFDLVQHLRWDVEYAASGKKPTAPKPYPRRWARHARRRAISPERAGRIADARRRQAERHQAITEGRLT